MQNEIHPTVEQIHMLGSFNGDGPAAYNQCPICSKIFTNLGSKRFHMRKSHDIDEKTTMNEILGVRPSNNEEYTKFFCPGIDCSTCKAGGGKHFKSAKLLLQHYQKVHSEKRQKCSGCSAKFSLERDLRYHRKKV
jgi:hypothetical protein